MTSLSRVARVSSLLIAAVAVSIEAHAEEAPASAVAVPAADTWTTPPRAMDVADRQSPFPTLRIAAGYDLGTFDGIPLHGPLLALAGGPPPNAHRFAFYGALDVGIGDVQEGLSYRQIRARGGVEAVLGPLRPGVEAFFGALDISRSSNSSGDLLAIEAGLAAKLSLDLLPIGERGVFFVEARGLMAAHLDGDFQLFGPRFDAVGALGFRY